MKKIKTKVKEEKIVAPALNSTTKEELANFTSSCVNHLCGCKSSSR